MSKNEDSMTKTYSELRLLGEYQDRLRYLELKGGVGRETFGSDRWVNQLFYTSNEWRSIRQKVILRDLGCDLGIEGYEIHSGLYIHHMNPLRLEQIVEGDPDILDPEFLITVTHNTHNAIHYGVGSRVPRLTERSKGDTKLW